MMATTISNPSVKDFAGLANTLFIAVSRAAGVMTETAHAPAAGARGSADRRDALSLHGPLYPYTVRYGVKTDEVVTSFPG
jgi:hypothetical protein